MRLLIGLMALAWSFIQPAHAHKLAPALMQIDAISTTEYAVLWRTGLNSPYLDPLWPPSCQTSESQFVRSKNALDQRFTLICANGLAGQDLAVDGLSRARTTALLRVTAIDKPLLQHILTAERPRFQIPMEGASLSVWRQYLALGVEHILTGFDHLLLVLGLFLLAMQWQLLLRHVTAFTLGHSLTLALVSLNWFSVSSALVELSIALTLLLMALGLTRPENLRAQRHYWLVIVAFGLIHGMGFAGVLADIGLPKNDLLGALLSFNIGIELGQIAFLSGLGALFASIGRLGTTPQRLLRITGIYLIGSMACYWCLDRSWQFLIT